MTLEINSNSLEDTLKIAAKIGASLQGGEIIELISDIGGGKTAFVRGLAKGVGSSDQVQSPTFTISRIYKSKDELELHHFDFYRLNDPGIMRQTLAETINNPKIATVIEWSFVVRDVLPLERLQVEISILNENQRRLVFTAVGSKHEQLLKNLG